MCLEEEYFEVSDIGKTELGQQHERIYGSEIFLLASDGRRSGRTARIYCSLSVVAKRQ